MKKYVSPEMDLVLLDIENVITFSNPTGGNEVPEEGKDVDIDSPSIFG